MDRVKIHIPIDIDERLLIRDNIANSLAARFEIVVIHFDEVLLSSIIEVYLHDVSNEITFFEGIADLISNEIGTPILLEIINETKYIGVIGGDLNDYEEI